MTDKPNHAEWEHRRELQSANVDVRKRDSIAYNHGSETIKHQLGKLAAARVLREQGYRIDSEVSVPDGEVDILGYANAEKDCIAVELETSPTEETISDKVEKYTYNTPIREVFVVNLNPMPLNAIEAVEYVADELGFEV